MIIKKLFIFFICMLAAWGGAQTPELDEAAQLSGDRNYREAWQKYRELALSKELPDAQRAAAYQQAVENMKRISMIGDFDKFTAEVLAAANGAPLTSQAAARVLTSWDISHYGMNVGGVFTRGYRVGGASLSSNARDRVQALQLMEKAGARLGELNAREQALFYLTWADVLLFNRGNRLAWKLQEVTDTARLPDYDEGLTSSNDAPVNADGSPLLYQQPRSYEAAKSDGEKWRWTLGMAAKSGESFAAKLKLAEFLDSQFGVQTIGYNLQNEALPHLADDEFYARLADGIKKFTLPDDMNPIKILRSLLDAERAEPYLELSNIYMRRERFAAASQVLGKWLHEYGEAASKEITVRYRELTGNSGRLEEITTFVAGRKPVVVLNYRNSPTVDLVVRPVDIGKFFAALESDLRGQKHLQDFYGVGSFRKIWSREQKEQFLGSTIEQWLIQLEPGTDHVPQRMALTLPMDKPGVYLLTATMPGVKEIRQIIVLSRYTLEVRPLDGKRICAVTNALTGMPVKGAKVRFFGWKSVQEEKAPKRLIDEFEVETDKDGLAVITDQQVKDQYTYLVRVFEANGGDTHAFILNYQSYNKPGSLLVDNLRIFGISDRPVYKPGDTVNFQFWLREIQQPEGAVQPYADKECEVTVTTPRGTEIWKGNVRTDGAAMAGGNFKLPEEVELGTLLIKLSIQNPQNPNPVTSYLQCRVEEYRKPEYEVMVKVPEKTVLAGEKFKAAISARYYWDAPVQGTISYRVTRLAAVSPLWRPDSWSWLYPEAPPYIRFREEPIVNGVGKLNGDGTFGIEIDTGKTDSGLKDIDHIYKIEATVSDASMRAISGSGEVMIAPVPYRGYIAFNKQFYHTGEEAVANINIVDSGRKPAAGTADLALYSITTTTLHKEIKKLLKQWKKLEINDKGTLLHTVKLETSGYYRLEAVIRTGGGYAFTVSKDVVAASGEADEAPIECKNLKITADKEFYEPGDIAEILISSPVKNASVMWFERINDGEVPKLVYLENGNSIQRLHITDKDVPNIFCEAELIHEGRRMRTAVELKVPPKRKILNVTVNSAAASYKPGSESTLNVKILDSDGKPVKGRFAITVYDKAVEFVSGGSNVADIKEFFWGRKRYLENIISYFNMETVFLEGLPSYLIGGAARNFDSSVKFEKSMAMAAMAGGSEITTEIRSDFRDTAFWRGIVDTDDEGKSTVTFRLPESITAWKARVWAIDGGNAVGDGETEFTVKKDVFARLLLPRFMVAGDSATILSIIQNQTGIENVQAELSATGELEMIDSLPRQVITKNEQAQTGWRLKAVAPGTGKLTMKATAGQETDGLVLELPVVRYGIKQQLSLSGAIAANQRESIFIPVDIPKGIQAQNAEMQIRILNSPYSVVIDLLPDLILNDRKDLLAVAARIKALAVNAVRVAPAEKSGDDRYNRDSLGAHAGAAVKELDDMQNVDGGWGWFSGVHSRSEVTMTATAVSALIAARNSGLKVSEVTCQQGIEWLKAYRKRDKKDLDFNASAYANYILYGLGETDSEFTDWLYNNREKLSLYSLSLLGLSVVGEQRQMVLRNLGQYLQKNSENLTAYLKQPKPDFSGIFDNSELIAGAAYLRLLLSTDSAKDLTDMLVKYLIENRAYTADESAVLVNLVCMEALAEYCKANPEKVSDGTVEIKVNGTSAGKMALKEISGKPQVLKVDPALLLGRRQTVELKRTGGMPVYFTVSLEYFNENKPIPAMGKDLKVKRMYWKLRENEKGSYARTELKSGDLVNPGDLIETELILNSGYNFRYLVIEDRRPAGLEPVNPRSGYSWEYPGVYIENRTSSTRIYLEQTGIGTTTRSYRLRAEVTGVFTALPATVSTLYIPGISGNSSEFDLKIGNAP